MLYNLKHENHQINVYDDNLNLSNSSLFIPDNTSSYYDSNLQNQRLTISSRSFRRWLRFSLKQRLRLKKRSTSDSSSRLPFSKLSSKAPFALVPLLLLPYSFNTLALSATTANTIQGTAPYLTFDGGATRGAIFDDLLSIELSDSTRYTATNISTAFSPIVLPASNQTFDDLTMVIPPSSSAITLNDSIVNNGYWGDDDGDGQGAGGVTITPDSITLTITDNDDQTVNRTDALDICKSPYKVVLSSPNGTLSTLYGSPNSVSFGASTATYYIAPNQPPKLCFAKPNLDHGTGIYAGPASMWNPIKGFIPQLTTPATYGLNFPTTGANGLYFDLVIAGVSTPLTWPDVTSGAVTAMMTPSSDGKTVRVLLTGPTGSITTPTTWPNVGMSTLFSTKKIRSSISFVFNR